MKTISRDQLIATLSQGEYPAESRQLVTRALEALGWAGKESFGKDDIPSILLRVAEETEALLAGQDDLDLRELAQGLGRMLEPVRRMVGESGAG